MSSTVKWKNPRYETGHNYAEGIPNYFPRSKVPIPYDADEKFHPPWPRTKHFWFGMAVGGTFGALSKLLPALRYGGPDVPLFNRGTTVIASAMKWGAGIGVLFFFFVPKYWLHHPVYHRATNTWRE